MNLFDKAFEPTCDDLWLARVANGIEQRNRMGSAQPVPAAPSDEQLIEDKTD